MKKPSQIAIDGPAASGKTTVGRILAKKLDYLFFDTGVMYRVATYVALDQIHSVDDEEKVTALTEEMDISLKVNEKTGQTDVLLFGKPVTEYIHLPEVDKNVSVVASYPGVRKSLTKQQRRIGLLGKVVMVGRDIGTVVMPDADLKIFLLASPEKRAMRRYQENIKKGIGSDYHEILIEIMKRDEIDSTRRVAPLRPAEDAILIDTDNLNQEQVVDEIFIQIKKMD
ncbi:MAG: (d)CMP kinase [Flexilinea sp.]